jgi:hypothetical protein
MSFLSLKGGIKVEVLSKERDEENAWTQHGRINEMTVARV